MAKKEKDIFDDILKISENKYGNIAANGTIGDVTEYYDTGSYMLNMQISGSIYGGLPNSQILTFAGESGVGKTFYALSVIESFLKKYKNGHVIYFDSENAINKTRLEARHLPLDRILHMPVMSLPELKQQWVRILDKINNDVKPGEKKFLYVVDSTGNLPSQKELDDALSGNKAADFTRAKELKSIFRMVTPKLSIHASSAITIGHTYSSIGFISMQVMGGGCLTKGHKIKTKNGIKEIQDIKVGDFVKTMNEDAKVTSLFHYENKDIFELELETGEIIKCTPEHKFLVENDGSVSWKESKDLSENDFILKI